MRKATNGYHSKVLEGNPTRYLNGDMEVITFSGSHVGLYVPKDRFWEKEFACLMLEAA